MNRRAFRFIVASAVLVLSRSVSAVGIGDIVVNSYVNEPLSADISILDPKGLSESEVIASLASLQDFERLGIDRHYSLGSLVFETDIRGTESSVIRVTTEKPIREPYLNFLVELKWPEGRVLREYTVFLDLRPRPQIQADGRNSRQVQMQSPEDRLAPSEYRVAPNDTLWAIASRFKDADVTIDQMMIAIKDANPGKFLRDNINGIPVGVVLEIPSSIDETVSSRDAKRRVIDEGNEWKMPARSRGLRIVADNEFESFDEAASESVPEGKAEIGSGSDSSMTAPSVAPNVNSVSNPSSARANDLAAIEARLTSLSDQLSSIQDVVAAKDEEIASLRAELAKRPVADIAASDAAAETQADSTREYAMGNSVLWGMLTFVFAVGVYVVRRRLTRKDDSSSAASEETFAGEAKTSFDDLLPVPSQRYPQSQRKDTLSAKGYGESLLTDYAANQSLADAIAEADIYVAYGRHQHALDTLEAASAAEPSNASGLLKMLEIYITLDRTEDAENLLKKIEGTGDREAATLAAAKLSNISDAPEGESSARALASSTETAESDDSTALDLSLDLEFQEAATPEVSSSVEGDTSGVLDTDEDPAETALDLARAYLDMGDKTGAKELLETAISMGDEAQIEVAKQLLASI